MSTILVVDDKPMMRDSIGETLRRAGFDVVEAPDGPAALAAFASQRPDCVVTDLNMPGMNGIELIERLRSIDEDVPLLLMTAYASIETAVKAIRLGAFNYIQKPFEGDTLIIAVKRALEHASTVRENQILRASSPSLPSSTIEMSPAPYGFDRLIGGGPVMASLKAELGAIAASQSTVLITGESGVGKEVIARTLHEASPRAKGPFLAVNCAALSESVLESELFGHERGAFTGADKLRKGRFELAQGGTILLDEVTEVSTKIQAKLLRVLQERQLERVGSSTPIGVDVRVIATSNRDVLREVHAGRFREDLYFRLNVLPIVAPTLRARREDIPELATHFVGEICRREGRGPMRVEPEAMDLLIEYAWPGNIRELRNICERAVVLSSGRGATTISRELVAPWLGAIQQSTAVSSIVEAKPGSRPAAPGTIPTLEDIERDTIVAALQQFNGHRQRTATALGIGVRTLGLKLRKWKASHKVSDSI
ncbi:MAG: sigma-54 dependent transcriptional regulator [Planctomycetota bacterium]